LEKVASAKVITTPSIRFAGTWKPARLERLVKTIILDDLDGAIRAILVGKSTGQTPVMSKTRVKV
jgi:hypothetical protein